ncbi:unnamed protein product [Leptidea sinapis]|uniref:Uncharacterized protein n=1 Tax=Leptidea sinapis TaxID=189913 RepID=A0A5E4Q1A7_9NEOP|nr:unnamed protein product [Leptidea sinapis]
MCRPNPGPILPNPGTGNVPQNIGANPFPNQALTSRLNPNGCNNHPVMSNEAILNAKTNEMFRSSYVPNAFPKGNVNLAELTNDAILSNNLARNMAAEINVPNPAINNLQVTPYISEVVPSLQCGDISMTGDLPIGGTIKVCGCFPVYGMIAVDGNVPSYGTAVVDQSFGNKVIDVVSQCANEYFS